MVNENPGAGTSQSNGLSRINKRLATLAAIVASLGVIGGGVWGAVAHANDLRRLLPHVSAAISTSAGAQYHVLTQYRNGISVAGYYSYPPGDKLQHVIMAMSDGKLDHRAFHGKGDSTVDRVLDYNFGDIKQLSAYQSDDRTQHVIVETVQGPTYEVSLQGVGATPGPSVPTRYGSDLDDALNVVGYYSRGDRQAHLVVRQRDFSLQVLTRQTASDHFDKEELLQADGSRFDGIQSIAAYYADSDKLDHILVATIDGKLHEIWRGAKSGEHVINTVSGARSVSAYYSPNDGFQHVVTLTDKGEILHFRFESDLGNASTPISVATTQAPDAVAAYAAGDGYEHVIVGATDVSSHGGSVYEIWFRTDALQVKPGN